MPDYKVNGIQLTSIANAIRTKGGTSASLTFPNGFVSAIEAIPSSDVQTDGDVIFIDYDGTFVAAKTKAQINAMTADSDLPANPSHTGLTAQGWNWTVVQLKAQLTAMPTQKVYVGQKYVTTSGATEIDIEMQKERLSPYLTVCVNGEISVYWGDNTESDTVTGTSLDTILSIPHTYTASGNYTITISVVNGSFAFNGGYYGGTGNTLLKKRNGGGNENIAYSNCVKAIRIGTGINCIDDCAFNYCYYLKYVTIPNNITSIGINTFAECLSLKCAIIPNGITTLAATFMNCCSLLSVSMPYSVTNISGCFYGCSSLSNVFIPANVTNLGLSCFTYCYALQSIVIPNGVTELRGFESCRALRSVYIPNTVTKIGPATFRNCNSLVNVVIPDSVTNMDNEIFSYCSSLISATISSNVTNLNSAFNNCQSLKECHIRSIVPPTINSTTFNNIPYDCVIYVPQGYLNDYQSASGWSDYASKIQEEPT